MERKCFVSPEFCISRSTSTHRRTNSSGVSACGVGSAVAEPVVTDGVGRGGAADEASSLQADSITAQHDSATSRRVTGTTPPEIQANWCGR
jgi:hypothetical protein